MPLLVCSELSAWNIILCLLRLLRQVPYLHGYMQFVHIITCAYHSISMQQCVLLQTCTLIEQHAFINFALPLAGRQCSGDHPGSVYTPSSLVAPDARRLVIRLRNPSVEGIKDYC